MDTPDLNFDPTVWGAIFGSPSDPIWVDENGEATKPLVGFRYCKVTHKTFDDGRMEPRLTGIGVGHEYTWQPGANQAWCRHVQVLKDAEGNVIGQGGHRAPEADCTCGMHACTSLATLDKVTGKGYAHGGYLLCGVIGWGKVREFEYGWRSEYAQIVAISDSMPGRILLNPERKVVRIMSKKVGDPVTIAKLGTAYEANIVTISQIEDFVKQYGS